MEVTDEPVVVVHLRSGTLMSDVETTIWRLRGPLRMQTVAGINLQRAYIGKRWDERRERCARRGIATRDWGRQTGPTHHGYADVGRTMCVCKRRAGSLERAAPDDQGKDEDFETVAMYQHVYGECNDVTGIDIFAEPRIERQLADKTEAEG
ncbi:hypothetical protein OBBRIDRAFT_807123 [Obba rivulosa]|uniref:Uncharacterized protein n=1 Tax=Obba rivulosa TaxID=1052685 RepID=A0A8E2DGI1_9APHY|nr:hypothetical protein OBBRIDRAFT_807123 [Obba rivulosa]